MVTKQVPVGTNKIGNHRTTTIKIQTTIKTRRVTSKEVNEDYQNTNKNTTSVGGVSEKDTTDMSVGTNQSVRSASETRMSFILAQIGGNRETTLLF